MTEEEAYMNYLENLLLSHNDRNLKQALRRLSTGMISRYVDNQGLSDDEAYIKFLERIAQKIFFAEGMSTADLMRRIIQSAQNEDLVEFCLALSDAVKENEVDKGFPYKTIQEKYQFDCDTVKKSNSENDLNAIFEQCRDFLVENEIALKPAKIDDGEKTVYLRGKIVKGEDGKAYFRERKELRTFSFSIFDEDDEFLVK